MARDIVAIDVHIHLSDETTQKAKGARTAQMAKYFGRARPPVSIDELADQYRARKMMAVLMNTRDETVTGLTPVPNDHVAGAVKKHPDVFLGFGARVDQVSRQGGYDRPLPGDGIRTIHRDVVGGSSAS